MSAPRSDAERIMRPSVVAPVMRSATGGSGAVVAIALSTSLAAFRGARDAERRTVLVDEARLHDELAACATAGGDERLLARPDRLDRQVERGDHDVEAAGVDDGHG